MNAALALAGGSSLCFGLAFVTSRRGLRSMNSRAGAAVSIPSATLVFLLAAPFVLDAVPFDAQTMLLFCAVGLFFPALVTLLTFKSTDVLGPTLTGSVSGTAPLFALLGAGLLLGEDVPVTAALAALAIAASVVLISWRGDTGRAFPGWALLWPFSGAMLRGFTQAVVKAGLVLWPHPFAAGLICYCVSSVVVIVSKPRAKAGAPRTPPRELAWFAITGILNGAAVLLLYAALHRAPVSLVAPVVATYPLVTALLGALLPGDEKITPRMWSGIALSVAAVAWLVASH
jgi:drug/metabolite transporter (DMT)-like permease